MSGLSRFVCPGYHHSTLWVKIPTSPPQDKRVKPQNLQVSTSKGTSKNIANHDEISPHCCTEECRLRASPWDNNVLNHRQLTQCHVSVLSSWRKLLWNWCVIQEFTAALLQDNFHADFLEATKTILNFRQKRKKLVLYVSGKTLHFPSKIGCFAYLIFSLYGFEIYIQRQIENHVSEITHLRRDMSCLAWRVFIILCRASMQSGWLQEYATSRES